MQTTAPIIAARHIVKGDVHFARLELAAHTFGRAFSIAEARALQGACREANRRYGTRLDWTTFVCETIPE